MAQPLDQSLEIAIRHHQAGQLPQAEQLYRQVLAQDPNHATALHHLGLIALQAGQSQAAADLIGRAIALKPGWPEAHVNLGNALRAAGRLDEAITSYRGAIVLKPDSAEGHFNLGSALQSGDRLDEAIVSYRQAIALKSIFPEACYNLAGALQDTGKLDEAIAAYRQAIAGNPGFTEAHSNLLLTLHYHPGPNPLAMADEHRRWNSQHAEPLRKALPESSHANNRDPDRRLRIGYVSPDFRQHAVAPMVLPLLACHDRVEFQVFCYAQVAKPDAMTERFRAQADQWRSTVGLSDEQLAGLVRQDQIDILVDLAGHTAGGRLLVFARKPAPVQVTRQGYPNTTGLTTIDYRMTDALADPPGLSDTLHSEQLLRLPRTNWIYQAPENGPVPDHPITGGPITFGSFNNIAKVTGPMLALWARILKAVPESRLLLKALALASPDARQRVRKALIQEGIDSARMELRGHEPELGGHLALYNRVDIALDPFPYHGTTTTCEALWMGVPVITLAGRTHVSRVGVSLLTNMGLAELIAESAEDYVRIAVDLAKDASRLRGLHTNLRQRLEQSPLMDAKTFARHIEAAYRQMWRKWCAEA